MNTKYLQQAVEIAGGQKALAEKIGVTQTAIWNILNGRTKRVGAEMAVAIEKAIGMPRQLFRPDIFEANDASIINNQPRPIENEANE